VLSIPDFNTAMSGYNRRMLVVIAATVIALLACLGAAALFRDDLRAFYLQRLGETACDVLLGLSALPALLVLFVGLWMHERRTRRDPRLVCPHCGKLLVSWHALVVATRNCARCGRRVLAEPESAAGAGR
jgi:hypothetical protein